MLVPVEMVWSVDVQVHSTQFWILDIFECEVT